MDAIMQALLGGDALTDDEKMRQTANALRGQKEAADFFGLSTIKPVARQANIQKKNIMDAALRGGRARQLGLEKMKARKQREEDLARENAVREARIAREAANREEDREWDVTDAETAAQNAEDLQTLKDQGALKKAVAVQQAKNSKARGTGVGKVPFRELSKLEEGLDMARAFGTSYDTAFEKDENGEYKIPLSVGAGGRVSEWVREAKGKTFPETWTDKEKQQATWWNQYKLNYEAPLRVGLFGTQFTESEQAIWNNLAINSKDPEDYIRDRLKMQDDFIQHKYNTRINTMRAAGVDESVIKAMAGDRYDKYRPPEESAKEVEVMAQEAGVNPDELLAEDGTIKEDDQQQREPVTVESTLATYGLSRADLDDAYKSEEALDAFFAKYPEVEAAEMAEAGL